VASKGREGSAVFGGMFAAAKDYMLGAKNN
jgi:hypothetical protein